MCCLDGRERVVGNGVYIQEIVGIVKEDARRMRMVEKG